MSDQPIKQPADKPKRQTHSYQTEATAMRTAIGIAVNLLAVVKVEKGSQDTMNAVVAMLKGSL